MTPSPPPSTSTSPVQSVPVISRRIVIKLVALLAGSIFGGVLLVLCASRLGWFPVVHGASSVPKTPIESTITIPPEEKVADVHWTNDGRLSLATRELDVHEPRVRSNVRVFYLAGQDGKVLARVRIVEGLQEGAGSPDHSAGMVPDATLVTGVVPYASDKKVRSLAGLGAVLRHRDPPTGPGEDAR